MLNVYARRAAARFFGPFARLLTRVGVSPDVVTVVGTAGVTAGALVFFTRGEFFVGTLVITLFVFSDLVDGTMARLSGRTSPWGAFLDSTLDRVGDAAIFGSLVLWFSGDGDDPLRAGLALFCLVTGAVVPYAKARAEGLGLRCDVGIAERSDRLVTILVATGLDGLGVPYVQAAALWVLAAATTVTVVQRMVVVRRQTDALGHGPAAR
ncbi:MAG: phosphatidylinositol phosphate synthase [Actinomycetes bacterium]